MSDPIDRRTMLASSLAWAALTLSGCSDNGGSGGTGGTGGTACGGSGGNGSGGAAGTGGSAWACTNSMTGSHTHPLTIPGADIESGNAAQPGMKYTLQDCGTGHTHTLELSAYDVAYLQAGTTRMIDSSTTNSHLHTVTIACTMG
jgi:hypothetical protein